MLKFLAYLPELADIMNALESVAKTAFSQGIELRPTIKGVPLRVRIERAPQTAPQMVAGAIIGLQADVAARPLAQAGQLQF